MNSSRAEKLDYWIKHRVNVIFIGKPGDAITDLVKSAFARNDLKWRYFGASPDDMGSLHHDLVRPGELANHTTEAVFLDDIDRAPKEVRNAVKELVQFGSIDGKRIPSLQIVWAAIKTEVEAVKTRDLALIERFHIHVEMP